MIEWSIGMTLRVNRWLAAAIAIAAAHSTHAQASGSRAEIFKNDSSRGVSAFARVGYSVKESASRDPSTGQFAPDQVSRVATPVAANSQPGSYEPCPAALAARGLADAAGASACQFSYALAEAEPPESTKRKKPARPSPEQLAAAAADRAIALAPEPQLRVAPARIGLTGLPSYFWLAREPEPISAQASAGGLVVTAEARPVEFVWDFGDGGEKVTSHSGRRWSPRRAGNIAHLYETKGRYGLTIDVIWEARWRVGGGLWQSLGYFSNSDARLYPVREVVAALVVPR